MNNPIPLDLARRVWNAYYNDPGLGELVALISGNRDHLEEA